MNGSFSVLQPTLNLQTAHNNASGESGESLLKQTISLQISVFRKKGCLPQILLGPFLNSLPLLEPCETSKI